MFYIYITTRIKAFHIKVSIARLGNRTRIKGPFEEVMSYFNDL
jgi:hypothetical protein